MGRLITHADGRTFHVGGRIQPTTAHHLKLHDPKFGINLSKWPATPTSTTYSQRPRAQAVLTDVLCNDKLGCCTESNAYHMQALRQAAAGRAVFHPTPEQVTATYSRDGGYVPGDPSTDQGCDETVVLGNAVKLGISDAYGFKGIDKLAGYVAVNAADRALVRAAITLFVGGTVCMQLPDNWLNPFPSSPGWVWDAPNGVFVPDPNNGHCFSILDQTDKALIGGSWGMPFTLTYDALAAGCSAAGGGCFYILIDGDMLSRASAMVPDGLDWAAVQSAFAELQAA